MADLVNPFTLEGDWYKANLHTHTTASDGQVDVAEAIDRYRGAGYDVLALTDHSTTHDVSAMSNGILVISGIEYHPPMPRRDSLYHLVGLNVPHGFEFFDGPAAEDCVKEVAEAGGVSILAHPYWCGLQYADIRQIEGIVAVEVWNAACDPGGRAESESEWAYLLDHGQMLPALAVDDTHWCEEQDLFTGWTWLKMPSLSVDNVIEAIRTGACYASCGPEIHDFRVEGGKAFIRCSPAERIHFISSPGGYGYRKIAPKGETICEHSAEFHDCCPYIRAVVTDHTGRKAWTSPIAL